MRFLCRAGTAFALALLVAGWTGSDGDGNAVEIERGQTVRQGATIDYFDSSRGDFRTLDVDSVRRSGSSVEIEGTDSEGNAVTLDMEE